MNDYVDCPRCKFLGYSQDCSLCDGTDMVDEYDAEVFEDDMRQSLDEDAGMNDREDAL